MIVKFADGWVAEVAFWYGFLLGCNSRHLILQNWSENSSVRHKQDDQQNNIAETDTAQRILFLTVEMHSSQVEAVDLTN